MKKKNIVKYAVIVLLGIVIGILLVKGIEYFSDTSSIGGVIVKYYPTPSIVIKNAYQFGEYTLLDRRIEHWGNKEAKEILESKVLENPDPNIRSVAVNVLCILKYRPAIPYLLKLLDDDKISIGLHLSKLKEMILPEMVNKLSNKNPVVRKNSCWFFCYSKSCDNKLVFNKLLNCLKNDPDESTRYAAAWALENSENNLALKALKYSLVHDKSKKVRLACKQVIAKILSRMALGV